MFLNRGETMKLDMKLHSNKIISEFEKTDEKEILMLYEFMGKEICKKFDFDYLRLLEMMIKRELKRQN